MGNLIAGMSDDEFPELPTGWEWGSANRMVMSTGEVTYTRWFSTTFRMGGPAAGVGSRFGGFDGEVYHDAGEDHHVVQITPIIGFEDDDPVHGYADISREFDTEREAHEAVPDLIRELYEKLGV